MSQLDRRSLFLAGAALIARPARADLDRFFAGHQGAFVLHDLRSGTVVRHNPERCRKRFPPQSTRKIAEGLIGLETRAIPDADHLLKWDGMRHAITAHNRDHSLRTALAASTNWYFERVNAKVGHPELVRRFKQLEYGNCDLGDGKKPYGEDELRISAEEQVRFLARLHGGKLPLSQQSMQAMREVMHCLTTDRGVLRGKTGTGGHTKDGKTRRPDSEMVATLGWFVGWVESGDRASVFALNISGGENPTGAKARRIAEAILKQRRLL